MAKKKKGQKKVVKKDFASLEDDFFAAGDEGTFMTDEVDIEEPEANVEDAPMEAYVPGDEGFFGVDGVPGDEVPGDEVPGDEVVRAGVVGEPDGQMSVELSQDEDMVATEAGNVAPEHGSVVEVEPEVVAEPVVAVSTDDITEVEPEFSESLKTKALAEAARNLPSETSAESGIGEAVQPTTLPRFIPSDDEAGRWTSAMNLLVAESASLKGKKKAKLLSEASRIARLRLGENELALTHAQAAIAADSNPFTKRQLAESYNLNGRWEEMKSLNEDRAGSEKVKNTSAELLQDAALLARHQLGGGEEVKRLLQASLEQNPEDYFSLQLLLEYALPRSEWDLAEDVLARMASLAGGTRAAAFHYQRGRILMEHLERADEGLEAFREAHAADCNHVSTILALQSLYAAGGQAEALLELYATEAERLQGGDGQIYYTEAARLARDSMKDAGRAAALFNQALTCQESAEIRHELQALLAKAGDWAGLTKELEAEVLASSGSQQAWVKMRLARAKESAGDLGGALTLYREIAEDPAAAPAADAVARILHEQGEFRALVDFWEKLSDSVKDSHVRVTLSFRMGEVCEGHLNDQEGARKHYETILDHAPGYLPALEALERVYTRLADWKRLAAIYEQRAILCDEAMGVALQIHRAAAVYEFRLDDNDRAREFYQRALDQVADFPPSLDALLRVLEGEDDWRGMSAILAKAAEASTDSNEVVSFFYRSARILADKVGDEPEALVSLRRCIDLSPGFLPAHTLLKELSARSGAKEDHMALQLQEARSVKDLERRHWLLMEAASLAQSSGVGDPLALVMEVLGEDPLHVGALQFQETAAMLAGNRDVVISLYQGTIGALDDDNARSQLAAVMMMHQQAAGDMVGALRSATEVLGCDDADTRPMEVVARLLEAHGRPEDAARALESIGAFREQARLQEQYMEAPDEALATLEKALEADGEDVGVLLRALQLSQRLGETARAAELHAKLANLSEASPIKVVHGTLAGHLYQAQDQQEQALAAYQLAFDARPSAGKASDALRRLLGSAGNADALRSLHKAMKSPKLHVAIDLLSANDGEGAAALLEGEGDLPSRVWREAGLEQSEQWQALYEAILERMSILGDEDQKDECQGKLRWLLGEKLQGTEEAWDAYTQLHEEYPEDRGILEALARIAGARGDGALALQYLQGLVDLAQEGSEKARIYRQIADVHQLSQEIEGARQAWLNALDHEPEDQEALRGLRSLAESEGDHKAVVGVLAREAALVKGDEQVALYARIARIWESDIGDSGVASEAWRKVLEMDGAYTEALDRLVDLTSILEDWSGFVQHAEARLEQMEAGSKQNDLLNRVGEVYLDQLRDESQAMRCFERAIAGNGASPQAAKRLEKIYRSRKDWDKVVACLQGQAAGGGDDAVRALVKCVKIQIEKLDNKEQAAATYQAILEMDAKHSDALVFLSEYRFKAGDSVGAVELYALREAQADTWDLDDFDVQIEVSLFYYHYALSLIQLGQTDDALARLNKALELNPSHLPSLQAVGPLYMEAGNWKQAEQVYRSLLKYTGGTGDSELLADTYANLGRVEWALDKPDKATNRFNKAISLQANNITALLGMGDVYFTEEDWPSLLNTYNNVIRFAHDPNSVIEAYLVKGHVLDSKMGLPDKAEQHYQKAKHYQETLSVKVNRPARFERLAELALLKLSELALRESKWAQAKDLVESALTVSKSGQVFGPELHLALALSLAGAEDSDAAQAALEQACKMDSALSQSVGSKAPGDAALLVELQQRVQAQRS
jgi:tetratricopeptide (TPR) repeat protein